MLKLYVGCGLTHAPQDFRDRVASLKAELKTEYEIFEFLGLSAGAEREVYEWDIEHCVAECNVFLAICDFPSLGLGYELATAIEKHGKPAFAVAHQKTRVTRLVLGIQKPWYRFERYGELLEIPELLRHFLAEYSTQIS